MTTTYGLPRQVITLLRHLEAYRDFLRWEISEGSHKVTLTLCWNFRKRTGAHESLWTRLQRSLHVSQSPNNAAIPEHLSRLLVSSPKGSHRKTSSSTSSSPLSSSFSRRFSWARISSLSLPARWRHQPSASANRNAYRDSAAPPEVGTPEVGTPSPSGLSLPVSPSRYSWHGMAHASTPSDTAETARASTPMTSTPDSVLGSADASPGRVRIAYRSEDEIARSIEDLDRKLHEENRDELRKIERQWDEAIEKWPQHVTAGDVNTSSDMTDASEENVVLDRVNNDTVQKCLETCDSILDKHSTLIL